MPVHMVSPRDYTLRTLTGHVIFFPQDVPVLVPDIAVQDAMAVNILPTRMVDTAAAEQASDVVSHTSVIPATLRDAVILRTITELVKENDPATFNAGGQPKLAVLNGRTGIRLSGGELSKYWDRYREIKGTNSPVPTHPRVESVMELQTLTTRKQLVEFASEIGVNEKEVTRRTIKEAKEFLMAATIAYMEGQPAVTLTTPPDTRTLAED